MKSIEEKLEYFEKTVIAQAIHDRDAFHQTLENKMKEALSEAEAVYQKEMERQYRKEIEETRKEARLIVSAAKNQGQTALMQKRNDIIDQVFKKLEERLRAFTKSEAYHEYFRNKLSQAMQSGKYDGTVTVLLSKEDAQSKSKLVDQLAVRYLPGVSVTLQTDSEDIIGGCRLRAPSSGRLVDNSIRALIEQEREQFLSWCNLAIQ